MKAKLKRGKVISGRLAEIFVSRKLAEPIRQGRPKKEKAEETTKAVEEPVIVKKTTKK